MYAPYDHFPLSPTTTPTQARTANLTPEEEFDRRWAHLFPPRKNSSCIKAVTYPGEESDYYTQELLGKQEEYVPSVLSSELRSALKPKNY